MPLVDTCIWSLSLRRRTKDLSPRERLLLFELRDLIIEGEVLCIGPIRQEILTGIDRDRELEELRKYLENFPDEQIETSDFVCAARFFNKLASHGVAGSATDLIICAVSFRLGERIFTTDPDFTAYAKVLPIQLHKPGSF